MGWLGYLCGLCTGAPTEHLGSTEHRPTEAIGTLPSGGFARGKQAGDGALAILIDSDPSITGVVMHLYLQKIAFNIDPLGPHERREQFRFESSACARKVQ